MPQYHHFVDLNLIKYNQLQLIYYANTGFVIMFTYVNIHDTILAFNYSGGS